MVASTFLLDREPDLGVLAHARVRNIFVYGTLKKGFHRNYTIKDLCEFVGEDILKGYLFHLGSYPAYVPELKGPAVHGEVWTIPEIHYKTVMSTLDGIEGHPRLYYRYPFRTERGYVCWAYWMSRDRIIQEDWMVIPDGRWRGEDDLTPAQKWKTFMDKHEEYSYPTKPHVFYDPLFEGWVCDQWSSAPTTPYLEVAKDRSVAYGAMKFSNIPTASAPSNTGVIATLPWPDVKINLSAEPKRKELEDSSVVDLAWLDDVHSPVHQTCNETHVDGI